MNSNKFCLLFCLISFFTYSQDKKELTNEQFLSYKEKIQHSFASYKDSVIIYADIVEKSTSFSHKAYAKAAKAYLFTFSGDLERGKSLFSQSTILLNKETSLSQKKIFSAMILNYGGLIDKVNKNYSSALEKFMKAKQISHELGDKIQEIKINNNIAIIQSEVGNYKSAINISRASDNLITQNQNLYTEPNFILAKNFCYNNLGEFYFYFYKSNPKKDEKILDSATYFFNKAISYSTGLYQSKSRSKINLASIYYLKGDFTKAESIYKSALINNKENNLENENYNIYYNLGILYFHKNDYKKALLYLDKTDSIYSKTKTNPFQYIKSNYYQAKIYSTLKNAEKALLHSNIYLENFEKNEFKTNNEITKVNDLLITEATTKEMQEIKEKSNRKETYYKILITTIILLFISLIILLFHNRKKTKVAELKVAALLEKYKSIDFKIPLDITVDTKIEENKLDNKPSQSINEDKEKEILEKLKTLEEKQYYLKPDFTQQTVAKKIKTNTTYISIVVNKFYNKTFSDYTNELRINHVIKEMINNPVYRKYSTQAIAESAGFKNNVSFTKSFNKRTGVTPSQFIKGLEKNH